MAKSFRTPKPLVAKVKGVNASADGVRKPESRPEKRHFISYFDEALRQVVEAESGIDLENFEFRSERHAFFPDA